VWVRVSRGKRTPLPRPGYHGTGFLISPSVSSAPRPWTLLLVELQRRALRRAQRQLLRPGPTSPSYVARYTSDRICRDSSDPF
jgi:hypothetical protein